MRNYQSDSAEKGKIKRVKNEEEALDFVNQFYDDNRDWLRGHKAFINLARAFFFGNQWINWDAAGNRIIPEEEDYEGQVRYTFSRFTPALLRKATLLIGDAPVWECVPASTDQEDVHSARLAEKILQAIYQDEEYDIPAVMQETIFEMLWSGTALIKVIWKSDVGRAIPQYETEMDAETGDDTNIVRFDEWGKPVVSGEIREGDFELVPVGVGEFIPQPGVFKMRRMNRCMHAPLVAIDDILRIYGYKVPPDEIHKVNQTYIQHDVSNAQESVQAERETAMVKEMWVLPCEEFPDGDVITIVGKQVLDRKKKFPYEDMDGRKCNLPFIKFDEIKRSKQFLGFAQAWNMLDPQKHYNTIRSQEIENVYDFGHGKWVVPETSLPKDFDPSNIPEVFTYNPVSGAREPHLQAPPSLIANTQPLGASVINDMYDISGIHEMSQGQLPGGSRDIPYSLAAMLIERDDQSMKLTRQNVNNAIASLGKMILARLRQYVKLDRVIRITGRSEEPYINDFVGADIKRSVDVRIDTKPLDQLSKAMKNTFLLESLRHMPGDTDFQKKIFMLTEFGGKEKLQEDVRQETSFAHHEEVLLKQGQPVMPEKGQKHDEHIGVHREAKNEQQWLMAPEEIKQVRNQHIEGHEELKKEEAADMAELRFILEGGLIQMQMQQQMGMQQGAQGPPPGAGGGPPTPPQGG